VDFTNLQHFEVILITEYLYPDLFLIIFTNDVIETCADVHCKGKEFSDMPVVPYIFLSSIEPCVLEQGFLH